MTGVLACSSLWLFPVRCVCLMLLIQPFFGKENKKKPKPALINEVQFHLACPAVIVPFKVLPALPFGKAALLPL